MAEGGEYSSSVRGSDACFDYTCTPCADDGDIHEALKYCLECKEHLCATCVKHHQKFSATKRHTLQDKDVGNNKRYYTDTTEADDEMFKCVHHPDRDIEMYCGAHRMVYCSLCVAKEHRQCKGIQELEEAVVKIPVHKKDDILRHIDSLQTDIQVKRQEKSNSLVSLEQEKNDILKTIEGTEYMIIDKVKELASDAKTKTYNKYNDLKKDIRQEDSVLFQATANANELRNKIETQEKLNTKRQFVRHILQTRSIAQIQKDCEGVEKNGKKMKCFKNDELIHQVSSVDYLVQIVGSKSSVDVKDNPVHKTSLEEVNIKGNEEKETCSIYGICQLPDDTLVLADNANKKLKRLNKYFKITEELDLESNPTGLCLTGETEVAVTMRNDTLLFISVDGRFMEKCSIAIDGGKHIGLVAFCNELWSFTGNMITVYDRAGTVTQTFSRKAFKGTIFQPASTDLIPVVADKEFIYVSDLENKVACLDKEGNVWSIMESEQLCIVRRASITQNGIIFLAGFDSGNIMMFTDKGKCLGELVNGLEKPDSLCYSSKTQQLIVGHKNKNILTIIKIDHC